LGSRIAMRIAALTARDVAQGLTTEARATIGRLTFEGTAFLVVAVGIGTALIGTAFYLATLPWLPRRRTLRALAFGVLELVVFGTVVLDPGNRDFTILGRPVLNVLILGSLFVLHGGALVLLLEPWGGPGSGAARGGRWRGWGWGGPSSRRGVSCRRSRAERAGVPGWSTSGRSSRWG